MNFARLTRPQAGVTALADPPLAIKRFDLEADHPALHRDHPRRGPHQCADRRRREMADVDFGTERDPAGFQTGVDGVAGRHLHFQNHHRGRIDHRHIRNKMPDRALRRHHQHALGAHPDFDDVACIHEISFRHSGARGARTRNLEIPGLVLRTIPE